MRQLTREIHLKQAALLQDRSLLAANARALQQRTLRTLATPQALAGSFGIGFAAAMLRCRHRPKHAPAEPPRRSGRWLHLLLHDVVMPLALTLLQTHMAAEQHHLPE